MTDETTRRSELLKPYVPRLLIDWLRETPEARWKAVEGSLAFVDISGFTKMTERLATKGKVGAEELNDTLDTTFTELLSVAYDYGAGLVKWGGDAVLLLFRGEDHAIRAARAAAGMQRTLRAIGRIRTSTGLVTLRMSVGIHSGEFHFFLVGGRHRELVITGPAATRTVAMESAAEAGEVLLSPETAALLDPVNVGAPKEEGLLLKGEPAVAVGRARPAPDVTGLDLASCLPETIREHVLADAEDAEHRPIATAFIEFRETDAMLEREGPGALATALDELMVAVQDAVHDHRVVFSETDISANGGKILLIAGAPASAGDDEERMLRTARTIIERELRLPIRIGVNCGRVFTGDFGPPYRRTYSCKGDALNTAARIMGKAQPGQALATEAVLARSRTKFELTPVGPFVLKGKAQPVAAFEIGPVIARESRERHELPLVGREEEMAVLLGALASAREGRGRLVELIGEPGIGKSRLVEELRRRAGDIPMLVAACEQYEASTPYHPFRGVFRGLLGLRENELPARVEQRLRRRVAELAPELEPWLPLLGLLLDLHLTETPEVAGLEIRFRRSKLEEVAGELLVRALPEPTLLVFEDVHWMDEASADLLLHLARGIGGRPWLLIPSRRDVDSGFVAPELAEVSALRPEPLDEQAALALIESETEREPLPPHVMAALTERAGGNPLFLAELASAARSTGVDALPDSVEGLLAAQIDRLDPRDRRVLRYAAVLGTSFPQDLLRASLEGQEHGLDDGVWTRLSDFVQRDRSGIARFRHALVRDAAYEGLPFRRRQELHGRVGETIERLAGGDPDREADALSFHFFNARSFAKAWGYSCAAGMRARDAYANAEACTFFRRALDAARHVQGLPPHELALIEEVLGDASSRIGDTEPAIAAYRAARKRRPDDPVYATRLLLREAQALVAVGRHERAIRSLNAGLRMLDGEPGSVAAGHRARLSIWSGYVRVQQGKYRQAVPLCRNAIVDAEAIGDRGTLAWAYEVLDIVSLESGLDDPEPYGDMALQIYEELGQRAYQANVLNNAGVRAYWEGRWDDAVGYWQRAAEIFQSVGHVLGVADATFNIGEVRSDQRRLEEAERQIREAARIWRSVGNALAAADADCELGRIAYRSGRFEEALALLVATRAKALAHRADDLVRETDVRIAECRLLMGDGRGAREIVDGLIEDTRRRGAVKAVRIPRLIRIRGSALLLEGEPEAALEELQRGAEAGREDGQSYELALTLEVLAHLTRGSDPETAARLETERLELLRGLGVEAAEQLAIGAEAALG